MDPCGIEYRPSDEAPLENMKTYLVSGGQKVEGLSHRKRLSTLSSCPSKCKALYVINKVDELS